MAFDFLLVLFSVVRNINLPVFSAHSRLADLIGTSIKRWYNIILLPYAFWSRFMVSMKPCGFGGM
jgi:hypothetical protein